TRRDRPGALLDQPQTHQLADQVGDGRSVEARDLSQLGTGDGTGEMEAVEDSSQVVPSQLLGGHAAFSSPQGARSGLAGRHSPPFVGDTTICQSVSSHINGVTAAT